MTGRRRWLEKKKKVRNDQTSIPKPSVQLSCNDEMGDKRRASVVAAASVDGKGSSTVRSELLAECTLGGIIFFQPGASCKQPSTRRTLARV